MSRSSCPLKKQKPTFRSKSWLCILDASEILEKCAAFAKLRFVILLSQKTEFENNYVLLYTPMYLYVHLKTIMPGYARLCPAMPSYARDEFGLRGLSIEADMLSGWSVIGIRSSPPRKACQGRYCVTSKDC